MHGFISFLKSFVSTHTFSIKSMESFIPEAPGLEKSQKHVLVLDDADEYPLT